LIGRIYIPVQPGQQVLGCTNQIDHGGEEVVGQPAGHPAVVVAAPPPAQDEVLQVLGRGVQLVGQRAQVLRLQAVVLERTDIKKGWLV